MSQLPNQSFQPGDIVKMPYKSGIYAGELVETSGPRSLVKVLAVLKHPEQGDLHHPQDPDVPMFHERRALSYTEKAWTLSRDLQPYQSKLPDYTSSLEAALEAEWNKLDRLRRWAEQGLEQLSRLREDYAPRK
ncbi:sporulation phosphorelay system protein KapB [Paenibacillus pinihumi]|uniref:sporulation phosphorelay system protein KapB n=1 Tax=Paenibacillus pinihumi TaxID=669462 RepID=UPI000409A283|nr:sporulation phosphorelay system protein KapB [Paenibacillus pinihumi]